MTIDTSAIFEALINTLAVVFVALLSAVTTWMAALARHHAKAANKAVNDHDTKPGVEPPTRLYELVVQVKTLQEQQAGLIKSLSESHRGLIQTLKPILESTKNDEQEND